MIAFDLKFCNVGDFILIKIKIFSRIFRRRFGGETIDKEILIKIGKMKLDVDAIKNGATEVFGVIVNLSRGTSARFDVRTIIATRAGVHGCEEREIGGKSSAFFGARN